MKTLVLNYKKTKGNNRRECPFYDAIDSIIGTRPAPQPYVLISSNKTDGTSDPKATKKQNEKEGPENDVLTYVSEPEDDNKFVYLKLPTYSYYLMFLQ